MTYDSPINCRTRVGRQLDALIAADNGRGVVVVTVSVFSAENRRRYQEAFAIRRWVGRDGAKNLSVSVHKSGDWRAGIKPITCLHLNLMTRELFAARDQRGAGDLIRYAAGVALQFAWTGRVPNPPNGRVEASEANLCGACGKQLTDWASIQRGYGRRCDPDPARRMALPSVRVHERQIQLDVDESQFTPIG